MGKERFGLLSQGRTAGRVSESGVRPGALSGWRSLREAKEKNPSVRVCCSSHLRPPGGTVLWALGSGWSPSPPGPAGLVCVPGG